MSVEGVLLVVEDEPGISLPLLDRLRREGFEVRHAANGPDGLVAARDDAVDLVILDLMLPGLDGSHVLATLREEGLGVPVICLTARTGAGDRVRHLQAGADDYVTKPFSLEELVARVRAVLRRTQPAPGAAGEAPDVVEIEGLQLDLDGHTVTRDGSSVALSALECAILRCLIARRGRATTRAQLLADVWGPRAAVTDRTIDFHVKNLRRKIEPDPRHPRLLLTDHGVGYRFAGPSAD